MSSSCQVQDLRVGDVIVRRQGSPVTIVELRRDYVERGKIFIRAQTGGIVGAEVVFRWRPQDVVNIESRV